MYNNDFKEFVKLIAFILVPTPSMEQEWLSEFSFFAPPLGELEHLGKLFPFNKTNYYENEMGSNLHRAVVSFKGLIEAERIVEYKQKAIELEKSLSKNGKRVLNIDCGYMDSDKVVLPSTKRGPFKIYVGNGFWLDMLLNYAKGDFTPTSWAFADFKENPYKKDLLLIREKYKQNLRDIALHAKQTEHETPDTREQKVQAHS